MKKRYKASLLLITIAIIIIVVLMAFNSFKKDNTPEPVKVIDTINNFDYTLDERDTKLTKDTYSELKAILKEKNIDYKEYALCLAKLFVIDLFTMDNKINKYDIGSTEYVYPDALDSFKANVGDTLYKHLIDNSFDKRTQELPVVASIDKSDVTVGEYKIGEEVVECYNVKLEWSYEKDLGYDNKATITLVKKDNKLYVVEYAVGDQDE